MKKLYRNFLSTALAAVTAFSFVACSAATPESGFDNPLPWGAYEKLEYDVAVYDTYADPSEEGRKRIASGDLCYVLEQGIEGGYTRLDMDLSMTYDSDKDVAGADAGCTDTITCRTLFEPMSLNTKSMTREVSLANRENVTNLSYKIEADYFGTHSATLLYTAREGATPSSMRLPMDPCHDNETMFFVARAQGIGGDSSTYFYMVNLFDCFLKGEVAKYGISVRGTATTVNLGEWVKDFGVEGVTNEETGEVTYPIAATSASLVINEDNHGPAYYVTYSNVAFKNGDEEHKKIPLKIDYTQYSGGRSYRKMVYTLKACSFSSDGNA